MNAAYARALGATANVSKRSTEAYEAALAQRALLKEGLTANADEAALAHEIRQPLTAIRLEQAEVARLTERLREAETLEAIGRIAAGIAHDVNNVLGCIFGYGEMLYDDAPEDSLQKRYAHNVLAAATRGQALIKQILTYITGQRAKLEAIDIGRAVTETLELVRGLMPPNTSVCWHTPNLRLIVAANTTQLNQIVTNLCSNAIDALGAGGRLSVALARAEVQGTLSLSHGTLTPARYARLVIQDNGCGMDEPTLRRVFEAFFTTKEVGHGTGLGLSLVNSIVTSLSGAIDVKSSPGQGSRFTVYLPLAEISGSPNWG